MKKESLLDYENVHHYSKLETRNLFLNEFNELNKHHLSSCKKFQLICKNLWKSDDYFKNLEESPYLPVSLFKETEMRSVKKNEVKITLTSSGTTGQKVSKVYLDSETSLIQQRALAKSMKFMLGPKRLPMLIIDTKAVFKDPKQMSARGAGVLGLMRYGTDHHFVLDNNLEFIQEEMEKFMAKYDGKPFFIFGFTYLVWLNFYKKISKRYDLSKAVLIHSGGWKKMIDQSVDNKVFRQSFKQNLGLTKIFNFYGMVEQTGSLFLEGPGGLLYPPLFSEVIIRDPLTWKPVGVGKEGVIQVISLIPRSYPGHSLLTEDIGYLSYNPDKKSNWPEQGLVINGRIPKLEMRGCSDVIDSK